MVDETRFLFQKLRLKSTYKTKLGQSGLRIVDEVTNLSGDPAEMQLLYHANFGPPILDPGAKVVAPVKTVVPRDARAAEGIGTWDSYPNEQAGYSEQVYFFELLAGSDGKTQVLVEKRARHAGRQPALQQEAASLFHAVEKHADGGRRLRDRAGAGHEFSQSALVRKRAGARGQAEAGRQRAISKWRWTSTPLPRTCRAPNRRSPKFRPAPGQRCIAPRKPAGPKSG